MRIKASLANKNLLLQVLSNKADLARGFMFKMKPPKDDEGLLFVFDEPSNHSFWMKNVFFDLDIIGFDESFRCTHIGQMFSMSERSHYVPYPALYILEVRAGWADEYGLKEGDVLILE